MSEPKVRFPEFSGTWIEAPLSQYLYENTKRNKNEEFTKNDVLSVSGEFGIVNQIAFQGRSFAGESVAPYHVVDTGDVVYTKSPLKANPYGIIKYNAGVPGIVSTLYAVYHCKDNVYGKFIELYFDNDLRLNKYLKPLVNIGAKHDMKVNNEHALYGSVVFPSLDEQRKIVSMIEAVDDVITTFTEEVRLWEEKKKGVMQKIFSQEVRFKDENGEDYPEWEEKKLSDCAKLSKGKGYSKSDLVDEGTPIILYGRMYTNYQTIISNVETFAICTNNSVISQGNEVIIPASGESAEEISVASYVSESGVILGGDLNIIRPTNELEPAFLAIQITYGHQKIELSKKAQGKTVSHLHNDDFKDIIISIPCLEEQQKVIECLTRIDDVIVIKKQKLETWKEIKKGLLQQMFV